MSLHEEGLDILLRQTPLTHEELLGVIEAHRVHIRPYLFVFHLDALGDVECLRTEAVYQHTPRQDNPAVVASEWLSLDTRGIFKVQPWKHIQRTPSQCTVEGVKVPDDGTLLIWGLTKDAKWVLIEITFVGQPGYKNRGYEKATVITIKETDVAAILAKTGEDPQRILETLCKAMQKCAEHCEQLHAATSRVAQIIQTQNAAIALILAQETKPSP